MTTVITFAPIELDASRARVSWAVNPPTGLYKQSHFTLDFGDALDPRAVPPRLWWTIVLLCLHSHWNLLRPCRVVLPVPLPAAEVEFWQRLLDYERVGLEWARGTTNLDRTIEILGTGSPRGERVDPPPGNRFVSCFSGGKESLLQAGLLGEFTDGPVLVTVHAPLPPLKDHDSRWFSWTMREIVKRSRCQWVRVGSDLRRIWDNGFPRQRGYEHSVNEITDTFLYSAAALAVAFARRCQNVSIAAELLLGQDRTYHGRVVPDFYYMYDAITLGALNGLLRQLGFSYGSLISSLSQFQIMELLHTRYPGLGELQISCWAVRDTTVRYCNECHKCLRVALVLLALGKNPAHIGLDLPRLFRARRRWPDEHSRPGTSLYGEYAAARIDPATVRSYFPARTRRERLTFSENESFRILHRFVERSRSIAEPWYGQYRWQYVQHIPAPLRGPLDRLYRECWELDPIDRAADLAALEQAVNHIVAPLVPP